MGSQECVYMADRSLITEDFLLLGASVMPD